MKKVLAFLILVINLLLCGVVSAQPLRRVADDNGVSVDFSTSAKQDENGSKLDDIETTNNAIQAAVELVRWVDTNNSTNSTLGNGGVYSGTWFDALGFTSGMIAVFTDQDSAANGLEIQSSSDGVNADHAHTYTISANLSRGIEFSLEARYIRIVFTNGATPQGTFRLQTIFSKLPNSGHFHPIDFAIDDSHVAELVRSVLTAQKPNDDYINIDATTGGNLKMSLEEIESGISTNNNTQLKVTEYNSVGSELWDSAPHAGYVQVSEIYSGSNNIGAIEIVDPNDDTRRVAFDPSFKALLIQEIEHGEIHEGSAYVAEAIDESMANNDTIIIAFKTPADPEVHMVVDFGAKASAHVELIEAPVWSTGTGSQLPVYNRDRNSANTTTLLEDTGGSFVDSNNLVLNPTNLAGGTVVPDGTLYVFAPTGLGSASRTRGTVETILAVSTLYALKLEADAATNAGHLKIRWYEHTPE